MASRGTCPLSVTARIGFRGFDVVSGCHIAELKTRIDGYFFPSQIMMRTRVLGLLLLAASAPISLLAGAASGEATQPGTRYGLFNWLDHRSAYGEGVFPEPFLVDDSDLEVNEARLDWLHTRANDQHSDLVTGEVEKGFGPLPGVLQFIPVLELSGETQLNKQDRGHNSLIGDLGFRVNLKTIGRVQPRPGLAFVFPIDKGGREEAHWGVVMSLVFEY
jgi:hypothetical protein